jgi:hypothetical protein
MELPTEERYLMTRDERAAERDFSEETGRTTGGEGAAHPRGGARARALRAGPRLGAV